MARSAACLAVGFLAVSVSTPAGGGRLLTLRCRPQLCTSNFSFLHLAVIEEDRAYDSNGSGCDGRTFGFFA